MAQECTLPHTQVKPEGPNSPLLVLNTLNATVGLALGLAWAFGHMPHFIAMFDNCC